MPSIMTAAPVETAPSASRSAPSASAVTTAWMPEKEEPSFTSTKERSFCARTVRTQPRTWTVSPTRDAPPSEPWVETNGGLTRVRVRCAGGKVARGGAGRDGWDLDRAREWAPKVGARGRARGTGLAP